MRIFDMIKGFVLGIAVTTTVGLLIYKLIDNPVITENNVADIVELDTKPPKISTDESGQTHATKQVIYVKNVSERAYFSSVIDSLKEKLNLKDRQIQGFLTAASVSTNVVRPVIHQDSSKRPTINYHSRWLDIEDDGSDKITVVKRDSIYLTFYSKQEGFLNLNKVPYADIASADTTTKFHNLRSVQIPRKVLPKITIGGSIGYGAQYHIGEKNITFGPQATVGLNFKF